MRKLIIGCGYLGKRVAERWKQQGDEVFALTRSEETARRFREAGLSPIVGDVMRPGTLVFPEEVETCLYAVGLDRAAGFSQREVYVEGLQNVLNSVSFRPKRLIYISSTSVYGQDDGEEIAEDSPTVPARENGRACLDAENLLRHQAVGRHSVSAKPLSTVEHSDHGLPASKSAIPWNILRLSGIYGPGRLLARKEKLMAREPLNGNPDGWLNLIHVDDAVQAVLRCEAHPEAANEIFLISDDRPILRKEYYSLLAKQFGSPAPVFQGDSSGLGKRCDNQKAREQLGFEPKYPSIAEGLPASV